MKKVDLHMHSKYSDGSCTVTELLKKANQENLSIISITDHDVISAYEELKDKEISSIYNGHILSGCECKTVYNQIPIEILGYGFDIEVFSKSFILKKKNLKEIQTEYLEYLKKVSKRIGLIFNQKITIDDNIIYASDCMERELKKYPKNIEILKRNNIFIETNFYRDCQSNKNSIFYIDETKNFPKPDEVIKEIHMAGGLSFLAHPFLYPFKNQKEEIENIIKKYSIDGVECYYSLFNQKEKEWIRSICDKYNKYVSGGSDFHGISKPDISVGKGRGDLIVNEADVIEWIEKLNFVK